MPSIFLPGPGLWGLRPSAAAQSTRLSLNNIIRPRVLEENIATLAAGDRAEVVRANVFLRVRWQSHLGSVPWVVFCSPPYVFYTECQGPMLDLIAGLLQASRPESPFVVEADQQFDFQLLPNPEAWDIRTYPPAVVGIYHKL